MSGIGGEQKQNVGKVGHRIRMETAADITRLKRFIKTILSP